MAATVIGRMGSSRSHGTSATRTKHGQPGPLRAHSDAHFKEAFDEASTLDARDDLFAKHIEWDPAPEHTVEWAMAEASDDDDDAPMPDAPPEPEVIDMSPASASAPPVSSLERCIALRLVYGAGPRWCLQKMPLASHLNVPLCCLACRLSRVS